MSSNTSLLFSSPFAAVLLLISSVLTERNSISFISGFSSTVEKFIIHKQQNETLRDITIIIIEQHFKGEYITLFRGIAAGLRELAPIAPLCFCHTTSLFFLAKNVKFLAWKQNKLLSS